MAQQQNQKPPQGQNFVGAPAPHKPVILPPILRGLLYAFFVWIAFSDFCYSSGFWKHHGDQLDQIVSYTAAIGSVATLLFLYLSLLWLERR